MLSPGVAIITHLNLSWFWFASRNADLLNVVAIGPAVGVNELGSHRPFVETAGASAVVLGT
eukprot:6479295-Prorocentrum_lima.AAC.1